MMAIKTLTALSTLALLAQALACPTVGWRTTPTPPVR